MSVSGEHEHAGVVWREVTFAADPSTVVTATVVSPLGQRVTRGAVLAHGGTDDGRRFFLSEAAAMAAGGAIVILPVTRMRPQDGIDSSPQQSALPCSPNGPPWTVNCQIIWFWHRFREADGWLIASKVDPRVPAVSRCPVTV